jgi:hypothetical protein
MNKGGRVLQCVSLLNLEELNLGNLKLEKLVDLFPESVQVFIIEKLAEYWQHAASRCICNDGKSC